MIDIIGVIIIVVIFIVFGYLYYMVVRSELKEPKSKRNKKNALFRNKKLNETIKVRDNWLDLVIVDLIGATVAAHPDSSGEDLDKRVYQLLKNAGITDDWLKENDWFTGDEIDDCSEDV